jgi:hypothetical protein
MPDAAQAVNRFPLNFSRENSKSPGFNIIFRSRHFSDGSLSFAFLILT